MRKFLGVVVVAVLLTFVVPLGVCAAESSTTPDVVIPEDGHIISSVGLAGDSSGWSFGDLSGDTLSLSIGMYGTYRVITYSPVTGQYSYYSDSGEVTYIDDIPLAMEGIQSSDSLVTAYNNSFFCTEDAPQFTITNDMSAYLLVFKDDASVSSIADAVCVCKVEDLVNYVIDEKEFNKVSPGAQGSISVTLVEKITKDAKVVGAKYRCDYQIGTCEIFGKVYDENPTYLYVDTLNCIALQNKSGSVEFELLDATNREYKAYIETDMGSKYSTVFTIDFIDGLSLEPANLSDETPVVEFDGIPTDGSKVKGPLNLVMRVSNVPVRMYIDGVEVSTSYCNISDVIIHDNGRYRYTAVSELGVATEGFITIDCLESGVSMSALGLGQKGESLVQTGFEVSRPCLVIVLCVISVGAVGVGLLVSYKRKRGE